MEKKFFDKKTIGIFLFFFIVYLYFLNPIGNPMSNATLDATISLVDKGNLEINKNFYDTAYYNGKYYSVFPPGLTFLAAPVYIITKPFFKFFHPIFEEHIVNSGIDMVPVPYNILILQSFCVLFIIIPFSSLLIVLFYKIIDEFSQNEKYKILTTFFLGFGTLLFPYSTIYYKDTIGLLFLFASFYLLLRIKKERISNKFLFLAGFLAGLVVLIHYFQIPIILLLFFYLLTFLRDRRIIFFVLGVVPSAVGILIYHWLLFGSPFAVPYQFNIEIESLGLARGFLGFSYPKLETIYNLALSPLKGLFVYSPILILALFGLFLKIKGRLASEMRLFLIIFFATLILNAAMQEEKQWSGGMGLFGPRHLLTVVPFLMIPLVFVFDRIRPWIVFIFGFISIFINYLGASFSLLNPIERVPLFEKFKENPPLFYFWRFFNQGPENPIFKTFFRDHLLAINIIGILFLILILFVIWKKFLKFDRITK